MTFYYPTFDQVINFTESHRNKVGGPVIFPWLMQCPRRSLVAWWCSHPTMARKLSPSMPAGRNEYGAWQRRQIMNMRFEESISDLSYIVPSAIVESHPKKGKTLLYVIEITPTFFWNRHLAQGFTATSLGSMSATIALSGLAEQWESHGPIRQSARASGHLVKWPNPKAVGIPSMPLVHLIWLRFMFLVEIFWHRFCYIWSCPLSGKQFKWTCRCWWKRPGFGLKSLTIVQLGLPALHLCQAWQPRSCHMG